MSTHTPHPGTRAYQRVTDRIVIAALVLFAVPFFACIALALLIGE